MAHTAGLDGRHPDLGDSPYLAQGGGEPVGGDAVGICRNAHEEPDIRAPAASKAVDQQAAERDQHWPLQARLPPSRRHPPADRAPLSHPAKNKRSRSLLLANRYPIRPRRPEFIPSTPCRLPGSQRCTGGVQNPGTLEWARHYAPIAVNAVLGRLPRCTSRRPPRGRVHSRSRCAITVADCNPTTPHRGLVADLKNSASRVRRPL
jgi:hypothetical protein